MNIFNVGRLAMKIAGRDAGRKCVVVEVLDDHFVIVDGNVRRKKVNIRHLEPFNDTVEIKDKASHEDVKAAFEKLGLSVWERKSKKTTERPKKQKKKKDKPVKEKKVKKSEEKSAEKKAEVKAESKETKPSEKSVEDVVAAEVSEQKEEAPVEEKPVSEEKKE